MGEIVEILPPRPRDWKIAHESAEKYEAEAKKLQAEGDIKGARTRFYDAAFEEEDAFEHAEARNDAKATLGVHAAELYFRIEEWEDASRLCNNTLRLVDKNSDNHQILFFIKRVSEKALMEKAA